MREIKFRAWDFKSEQMFEVDEIRMRGNAYTVSIIGFSDKQWLTPERTAIMQYTGLLDKNGKEIYEGDIVHYRYYGEYNTFEENVEVMWIQKTASFSPFSMGNKSRVDILDVEVIGDVYQNPELIK